MIFCFQEEKFQDVYKEAEPILLIHWKELANNQDIRPLDPDYERYCKLQDKGILNIFTARVDSKLVAYSSFIIANHLHYKTWKMALNDIYYVDPTYRKQGLGLAFFKNMEQWLKDKNVNQVNLQDKVKQPHKEMFEALGFTHTENNYEKIL